MATPEPPALEVKETGGIDATVTPVTAAVTSTTLIAANRARNSASVYYDGAAMLYLLAGSGTPTATNYTVKLGDGFITYWEPPDGYMGDIKGIWSAAVGSALVTEYV